jgi:hypothetical protein
MVNQETPKKRGRKPQPPRTACCDACGVSFQPIRGANGTFCSKQCMNQHRRDKRPDWMGCSVCLSKIGIGMAVQARLLRTSKSRLSKLWAKDGIRPDVPECGSWRLWADRKKSDVCRWWGNSETAALWMRQHRAKFPDWSCEWGKEKANRKADQYYNSAEKVYERACYRDILLHRFVSVYPDWSPIWQKSRMSMRAELKAVDNLRKRFRLLMRTTKKGGSSFRNDLLGCSTAQFKKHLESQFKRSMTWENYGTEWHVDHILPCASFDHTNPRQVAQCWHWTNLAPLDAKKNIDKGSTITKPQMSLLLCISH